MRTLLCAALLCAAVVFACPRTSGAQEPAGDAPRARKIDEFGRVGGCDHGARLDNFALELMNHPDAEGYVIAYGPRGDGDGTAEFRLHITQDYLVNTRGLDAERIRTVNGGRYRTKHESFVEFWLVPRGAEPPRPGEYQNDADKFAGKYSEHESWDSYEWGEGTGPSVGNSLLAGFADVLRSQPEARAYVVAFNGEESATGAWRRVAERQQGALLAQGVGADRVRIVFGGYDKKLTVQFWALPKDAPPPVRDAGPERRPAEAVQVARMNDYQLKYEEEQRSFFRGFAEVLRADEALTAHLIVRLSAPPGPAAEPAEPPSPDEPPEVDLVRLAEKWREELKKDYGITDRRLVIQIVPPQGEDAWGDEGVEAWVVPPGAAPPDPYAKPEVEGAEEAAEEPAGGTPEEL